MIRAQPALVEEMSRVAGCLLPPKRDSRVSGPARGAAARIGPSLSEPSGPGGILALGANLAGVVVLIPCGQP